MLWDDIAFQVILSARNNEHNLLNTLTSIDNSFRLFDKDPRWILHFGDNGSEDETLLILAKYAETSSADKIHLYDYDFNKNTGIIENNLIKESKKYNLKYPCILFMEAGGIMMPERLQMINTAISYESPYVVGAWENLTKEQKISSSQAKDQLYFGAWATLLHHSIIPEDGKLFYEKLNNGRDILRWIQFEQFQKLVPVPHSWEDESVHICCDPVKKIRNGAEIVDHELLELISQLQNKKDIFS